MVTHMKTTIEISDDLLTRGRKVAEQEHTTLRNLVEEGLSIALAQRSRSPTGFKFRPVVFKGRGIRPEFQDQSWGEIRAAVYRGRGA